LLRPIHDREPVARFILGSRRFIPQEGGAVEIARINGKPAVLLRIAGRQVVLVVQVEVSNGQIQTLHVTGNPDKLRHLNRTALL
jgi:hypothetical protein